MGREVRRVPKDWEHPKDANGHYIPKFDGYNQRVAEWDEENEQWKKGFVENWVPGKGRVGWKSIPLDIRGECKTYKDYNGERPDFRDYMPDWPVEERTHYQMYETCSEGTPISPVMDTPEKLARWLVDHNASAFADLTADYESWLHVCKGGFAPSAATIVKTTETDNGLKEVNVLVSGVEAIKDCDD